MSNKTIYPSKFEDAKMNVPAEPNVEFSFVVKAPKEYVMDAWNLPKSDGGAITPVTPGIPNDQNWPGIANDMERIINVGGTDVTQVVGNVQSPEHAKWHFEWKAGEPYYKMPFPFPLIMKSVHGKATLTDGPGKNETTVKISNRHKPVIAL